MREQNAGDEVGNSIILVVMSFAFWMRFHPEVLNGLNTTEEVSKFEELLDVTPQAAKVFAPTQMLAGTRVVGYRISYLNNFDRSLYYVISKEHLLKKLGVTRCSPLFTV